jgi:hypothetical protein
MRKKNCKAHIRGKDAARWEKFIEEFPELN